MKTEPTSEQHEPAVPCTGWMGDAAPCPSVAVLCPHGMGARRCVPCLQEMLSEMEEKLRNAEARASKAESTLRYWEAGRALRKAVDLHRVDRPLVAGTEIEYCGEVATVVRDEGRQLLVEVPGEGRMRWWWRFQGVECTVTKRTNAGDERQNPPSPRPLHE